MRTTVEQLAPDRLDSHRALATALRELNLAAGTTLLDPERLDEATAAVIGLTDLLSRRNTDHVVRSGFLEPRDRAVAGEPVHLNVLNPALLGLSVAIDHDPDGLAGVRRAADGGDPAGLTAHAELTVDALHEGPTDAVHGGIIAFLMDCVLGVLVQATGTMSVTGTLDVRYLRRTPLDEPVVLGARVLRRDGRKISVEGWIQHGGTRTVSSRGLFIAVQPRADRPPAGQAGT